MGGLEETRMPGLGNGIHARAGTCLLVVANQERERLGLYNPVIHDMDQAIRVGIEGVRNLIRQDQQAQK